MRFKRSGLVAIALLLAPALTSTPAGAAGTPTVITSVLARHTVDGQPIPCMAQADGVRVCHGDETGSAETDLRLKSFDRAPLDIYVTLPPAPTSGTDGDYPLIVQSHGWGEPPSGPDDGQFGVPTADQLAQQGYAVVEMAARGWGDSCGTAASRHVDPTACVHDYIHLDDERYEARDVQDVVGLLVDEGIANPDAIGVAGESYGGGVSLELATLNDRVMRHNGTLVPWRSPRGTPLHIAAAAPYAGWSDLVYALLPNGRTVDSGITSATADLAVPGVEKESITSALYEVGLLYGVYAPAGTSLDNETTWYTALTAGEPYDTPKTAAMIRQLAEYHSPYYLLAGAYGLPQVAPAPIFMANGVTDDIFPASEGVRYANLERSLYPSDPITLFDFDGGHPRGQNKPAELEALVERSQAFFDYYLKGVGARPARGVTVFTQTCPSTAPAAGPYTAGTWNKLSNDKLVFKSDSAQTVLSTAGSPAVSEAFDPVAGGGACATAPATDQAGVASYRMPAAGGQGYTLLGAATVTADLTVTGSDPCIAAHLLDVDPATDTETLVARGLYRIDPNAPDGRQTFQLNPGAWEFAPGHIPKLELLGQDAPYARPSNGTFSISVSKLKLRLPVRE